jgi:hypothetical protein
LAILVVNIAVNPISAKAQSNDELVIHMRRDFGYSSGTGKIQGAFSITTTGPESLTRVAYYIDDQTIGESNQSPFRVKFNTDNFPKGVHTIYAVGYTSDGLELHSKEVKAEFVSAGEGWKAAAEIAGPLIGVMILIVLLATVLPMIRSRGKKEELPYGTTRNYGIRGGAICPQCKRPFVLHLLGLNLLTHRLDRCPYCGKWSAVKIASLKELREAEAAELADAKASVEIAPESEEEKLRKELEDSRYQGM